MKRQEVFKAFRELLSPSFAASGFTYSKEIGGIQFLQMTDFGFHRVIITVAHYGEKHDFGGGGFDIRFDNVEDILSKVFYNSGKGALSSQMNTTRSNKPFSDYLLNKPLSETTRISNIEDINRICKIMVEKVLPAGLAYLEKTSLDVVCAEMTQYENLALVAFINAGAEAYYLKPITIAKLCNHPKLLDYQKTAEEAIWRNELPDLKNMYINLCDIMKLKPLSIL